LAPRCSVLAVSVAAGVVACSVSVAGATMQFGTRAPSAKLGVVSARIDDTSSAGGGAAVRVVNLVTLRAKPTGIVVYDTPNGQRGGRPLTRVAYGAASAYLRPVADQSGAGSTTLSFYRPGRPTHARLLGQWNETLQASDQVTVLVGPNTLHPSQPVPVFTETQWERGGPTPPALASTTRALVLGNGFVLGAIPRAPSFGVQFGIPGHGCLAPAPDSAGAIHYVGGTDTVAIEVEPGTTQIAAYSTDDLRCKKRPDIRPVRIETRAGDRVYVLVFGTSRHDLKLLVAPIPRSRG